MSSRCDPSSFCESKYLPFSTQDVRDVCSNCRICAELKLKFYQSQNSKLVKAKCPMERFSIDFKGPLPTCDALDGVVAPWCYSLTLQPEQSGGVGSSPGRAPLLKRHDKGSQARLGLLYFCDPSAWR